MRGCMCDPVCGGQLDKGGQSSLGLVLLGEFSEKRSQFFDKGGCSGQWDMS